MDFEFTPEQIQVRDMVREWAQREVAPYIREWDAKGEYHPEIYRRMGELGLLSLPIPERYGGGGFDYIALALACEELEAVDTFLRVAISVHVGLNSLTLLQWGTEEQKQRWLVPQARGEKLATFALTEPGAGSDAGHIQTRAVRDGDSYILNGEKMWISLANTADHFLVFATLDPALGHRGLCAFMVERGMPGLTTGSIHGKLGVRAGDTGWISLQNVRVPAENMIGEPGEGFKIAMSAIDQGRFTVAAGACGLIRACLEASVKYCHERQTFGQEIGRFQLVQQMIAKMVRGYETSRLLVFRAAELKNRGIRNTRETSLAKWHACDCAFEAANDAVQIHGAYGYSGEYPVERYFRNSRGAVIYEGTREIHTLLQAEYALGYRVDKPLRCPQPPAQGYETVVARG
ncbi:MAG: acyl-CoA dehydrogenase family protein [Thermomicrobium sp.]|uniref:acyl-CoA dehydrogenase family protein n=1 Tax=Thermomicrobium sp. TaxID=1969469 RepID=UPI001B24DBFB|nr:acyl-CoA dehydrogenase family protein [Thermomicrobium sp.]MBO9351495.1 acyl-CoA dehydrogenase family protein [Thermomicrobium sp.]